jgi:addiction module RelE/StbE family toxin
MKISWSRRAAEHLAAIRKYIEEDNPEAAQRVALRIIECLRQLAGQPMMGRPGRVRGTRELVISGTPYVAPYRVKRGALEIIAVFHGRQKWPKSL